MRRAILMTALVASCVGCDQGTKRLAVETLKFHSPKTYLHGSIQLFYAENTGAFGSLGEHWPSVVKTFVFIVLPIFVLIAVGVNAVRSSLVDWLMLTAYGLIIGGGLGNIVDRIHSGYVVDFLYLRAGSLSVFGRPIATNVFNVADLALMAGLAVIVFYRPQPKEEKPA